MKPGDQIRLVLDGMGRLGEAMASVEGKPVFVFGGLAGEEVMVEIIRERRQYIAAEVIDVITQSPHRVDAPCQYFGKCTGCQWQHIDYGHQLNLKLHIVEDALSRVGGFDNIPVSPTLGSDEHNYRNHARFTVNPHGRLGFVHRERRRFVDIEQCMLMNDSINEILGKLQGHCKETTQASVRYGVNSGSFLVQPTLKNIDVPLESGQKHYREILNGVPFRVAASSFFQVNTLQAERIVELVRQSLQLSGNETVVDAYAGVGTFAALLSPHASKVIAIEESASAISDANENLEQYPNVVIYQGKTESILSEFKEPVDALILDPPRAGCQKQALESLIHMAPKRIAYVSCDPATLARDLRILVDGPYQLENVQPVDMFPQTHHIECIATLSLKRGHPITLASTSPRRQNILKNASIPFKQIAPEIGEETPQTDPWSHVSNWALAKAQQVATTINQGLVIGADTEVICNGNILGKPRDVTHAKEMLQQLRGRKHEVITGIAIVDAASMKNTIGVTASQVEMRSYTDEEIFDFITSGESLDKAGGYSIQDPIFKPVSSVDGCYLNVVGLPLCLVIQLLNEMDADLDPTIQSHQCHKCHSKEGIQ